MAEQVVEVVHVVIDVLFLLHDLTRRNNGSEETTIKYGGAAAVGVAAAAPSPHPQ